MDRIIIQWMEGGFSGWDNNTMDGVRIQWMG